jgi:hypothetical protein
VKSQEQVAAVVPRCVRIKLASRGFACQAVVMTVGPYASVWAGKLTCTAVVLMQADAAVPPEQRQEIGGYKGPEPTRHGDWEHKGRCTDF